MIRDEEAFALPQDWPSHWLFVAPEGVPLLQSGRTARIGTAS
jgi:hypothetical protein